MRAFVAAGSQWRNRLLDKQLLIFHVKEARHIPAVEENHHAAEESWLERG